MKAFIKIHEDLFNEFKFMSYNQIMLLLYLCMNEESGDDIKQALYKTNTSRFKKDLEVARKYEYYIKEMRELENPINKKILKKNKKAITRYYKLKVSTFKLILNDPNITKSNLLIILSFIKLYQNTFVREHKIKIKNLLSFTFNTKTPKAYKPYLIETLKIMKDWTYSDGSVFLNSYTINTKILTVILDKKG